MLTSIREADVSKILLADPNEIFEADSNVQTART